VSTGSIGRRSASGAVVEAAKIRGGIRPSSFVATQRGRKRCTTDLVLPDELRQRRRRLEIPLPRTSKIRSSWDPRPLNRPEESRLPCVSHVGSRSAILRQRKPPLRTHVPAYEPDVVELALLSGSRTADGRSARRSRVRRHPGRLPASLRAPCDRLASCCRCADSRSHTSTCRHRSVHAS
jgi:hypothetical protein